MPAIHIERLEQQIKTVFDPGFPAPVFNENFKSLLEVHSNRAYQAGTDIQRKSLVPKLHLAPIVMQNIRLRFIALAKADPQLALEYADEVWTINTYETKFFAATILGSLSNEYLDKSFDRFIEWGSKTSDQEIHEILFTQGTTNIRQSNPNKWLEIIREWSESNSTNQVVTSIYAMRSLIHDPSFQNIPRVFKMITPLFSMEHRKIITTLQFLMIDLAEINPGETSHYLSSVLLGSSAAPLKQIVRKSLKSFPDKEQMNLRKILQNISDE